MNLWLGNKKAATGYCPTCKQSQDTTHFQFRHELQDEFGFMHEGIVWICPVCNTYLNSQVPFLFEEYIPYYGLR